MRVLEGVDNRKPWLDAEKHRCVAVRDVEIDEQRTARRELRQSRRDIHGNGCRPHTALGAEERVGRTRDRRSRTLRGEAGNRRRQVTFGHRRRHELVDARTHCFEQQSGFEAICDDQNAGRRVLPLQDRQRGRQMGLPAQIQHQHVRLFGVRLCERRELRTRDRCRRHAAGAQRVLEQTIVRTD
jgi:hypothetical protein